MPIGCRAERDHPLDLVDDLAELGLRQIDVRASRRLPASNVAPIWRANARRLAGCRGVAVLGSARRVVVHGTSKGSGIGPDGSSRVARTLPLDDLDPHVPSSFRSAPS